MSLFKTEVFPVLGPPAKTTLLFKFIVKNNSDESEQLKKYLKNYEGKIAVKSSSNNKFLTFTFEYYANSPSEVIDIYKGLEFIDNIISL